MHCPDVELIADDSKRQMGIASFRAASVLLKPLLESSNGCIYGSWAIGLQLDSFPRIPMDLDFEICVPGADYQRAVKSLQSVDGLNIARHEPVRFSAQIGRMPTVGRALACISVEGKYKADLLLGFKVIEEPLYPRSTAILRHQNRAHVIPVLPLPFCVAQKVVRLSLLRVGGKRHTRWRDAMDLYDVLLKRPPAIERQALADAIDFVWTRRGSGGIPQLCPAPSEWADDWDQACFLEGVARPSPEEAVAQLNQFLHRVTSGDPERQ